MDWNVTSKPGTLSLSHGQNLYQREKHVHLAGEVITPHRTGDLARADPQYPSLFSSNSFTDQTEEKGSPTLDRMEMAVLTPSVLFF